MEYTKVYVVEISRGYMFSGGSVDKVFFSKRDADFYIWKKNKEDKGSSWMGAYYYVREGTIGSVCLDEKEYKKFVAEQVVEIDKQIKEKEDCAEKDTNAIQSLQKEKESLSN